MIMGIWPLGHGGTNPPARLAWPPPDRRVDGPALLRPVRRPGSFVMVGATMTEEGVVTNGTIPRPPMRTGAQSSTGPRACKAPTRNPLGHRVDRRPVTDRQATPLSTG